jgi:RND family efflux transporter MFP subunit
MKHLPWLLLLVAFSTSAELATHTAGKAMMPLERWFDGSVAAVRQTTVSAETSARVQELLFDVGDVVPPGAVILRLVSVEQRENFNQAEAALTEARANLEVETLNYERNKELLESKLIAKSDFDKTSAQYSTSKARLASAEAALKTAVQRLSYTEIRAPYGGVVSGRFVEIGEAVSPGKPLMSGFDPNAMRVEVDIPQAVANQVREQNRARVITDSNTYLAPAQIILFPIADPATNTVRVRLELPEQATGLKPGQFVKVAFTVGETERLLVPAICIVYRSEVSGLYVIGDKGPGLRQVRLGNQFGTQVEVLAGLEPGEQIALDPVAAGISLVKSAGLSHE